MIAYSLIGIALASLIPFLEAKASRTHVFASIALVVGGVLMGIYHSHPVTTIEDYKKHSVQFRQHRLNSERMELEFVSEGRRYLISKGILRSLTASSRRQLVLAMQYETSR